MKWLILVILLINATFFSYHYYYLPQLTSSDTTANSSLVDTDVGGIVLLLEASSHKTQMTDPAKLISDPIVKDQKTVKAVAPLLESCFYLEGFETFDLASINLDRLLTQGFIGTVVEYQAEILSGYWVLTKRYTTRNDALVVLREMQRLSIDSFIIESGEDANAISVGLFTRNRHALNRKRALAKQGFEVNLKEHYRELPRYRLAITFRGINAAPPPMTYIDAMDGQISLHEKKCQEKPKKQD